MAFLNENEWIRLNEIAYNISFIYTVEEMQHEILNRWLPFLISYDSAIFARISIAENGSYQFQAPSGFSSASAGCRCLDAGKPEFRCFSLGAVYL